MNYFSAVAVFFTLICSSRTHLVKEITTEGCSLPADLVAEIRSYQAKVDEIVNAVVNGSHSKEVWQELADFTDDFGNRIAGSENLENAIDYMVKRSQWHNVDVHTEPVSVPHWVRGEESATMLLPRVKKLSLLGLGGSIGTRLPDGITAEVIVVEDFDELKRRASEAKGKIVVFAEKWISYGTTVSYRSKAASSASKVGAVASLIRSISPFSLNNPHTGWQSYESGVTKIPTAAITIEDANLLLRIHRRGIKIIINLKMEAKTFGQKTSRNTIVQLNGTSMPDEYVLVSGHLDSWDVGNGAMDDGGGAFISWYAPILLKKLNLIPRRSVRAVLWTGEEEGLIGAFAYKKAHQDNQIVLAMESDEGTFNPRGITMKGTNKATCIVQEIVKLLGSINATTLELSDDVGSDIMIWANTKVPLAALKNDNERYFWYHHSDADTMEVEDPDVLDRCLAVWTAVAYVVADLSVRLPVG
ncbi:plasma glutamate [Nesidiocoris tenuis]|uniref:Carboxypeptidase Q n=1 Tax=Nesidiocoris tenuis TaxID=355587 RepID=A0ABN7A8R2_9HEMI|nr:plasma glutamate [Nesidiocoris tenuis]